MTQLPRDAELHDAMSAISHWHTVHPNQGPETEPEEISLKRKLLMNRVSSLREGDLDPWMGRTIKTLVRKTTRYIVYIDDRLDVQWWWTMGLPKAEGLGVIQANITRLTHASSFLLDEQSDLWRQRPCRTRKDAPVPPASSASPPSSTTPVATASPDSPTRPDDPGDTPLPRDQRRARETAKGIRMLIAESLAMYLNGAKQEECEKVQRMAEEQILVAKDQLCRGVFFAQFLYAVLALFALTVALMVSASFYPAEPRSLIEAAKTALAGAFGAMLFATSRTQSLHLEPDSGRRGLRTEAWSRALIGAGAGLLTHYAFESEIIVKAALKEGAIREATQMFLCIASGWSERILPSLLGRAESLVSGGGKKD